MAVTDELSILRGPYSFPDGIYGSLMTPADNSVRTQALNLLDFNLPTANQKHRVPFKHTKAGTLADETAPVYIAETIGTLMFFSVFITQAMTGDAVVTIDLKKNNVSVLTAPISLSASSTIRTRYTATILTSAIAANQVYEVVIDETHTTGTVAQGLCAQGIVHENAY